MKYFFDTEFIEDGKTIDLISIGIVAEDERTFYAISREYKYDKADEWVRKNVILPCYLSAVHGDQRNQHMDVNNFHKTVGWTREEIKLGILDFIGEDQKPQFYAYYADYDWVVFCQLFGRMIDLPKCFPMYCIDLKQMMKERGLDSEWGKANVPQENEHHALADAKWNKKLYDKIISCPHH